MATRAAQVAGAQARLDAVAAVLRQAAVVRGDDVVAEPLAELVREPLGEPARVDEDERRAVLADVLRDPVEHVGHLLRGRDGLELAVGQLEREVEVALVAARRRSPAAAGRRRAGARRSRSVAASPTARRGAGRWSHSASSRSSVSGEVRPALVARDRVDLVDDHRLGRAQERRARCSLVTSR